MSRMKQHGKTWAILGLAAALLAALNFWCWTPGTGGGPPGRPPGTEVELYFGFPATHRAELWRTDEAGLMMDFLRRGPFFHPAGELGTCAHYLGWPAALADVAFAAVLLAVGVWAGASQRGSWSRGAVAVLVAAGLVMAMTVSLADRVSVHL